MGRPAVAQSTRTPRRRVVVPTKVERERRASHVLSAGARSLHPMVTSPLHTVLVPGLLCSARLYEPLLPTVWSRGAVTVADNRRDSTVESMARRLLAAAPDQFALVGLSMGGYVALEVMRLAPERVSALALISTSARPDTPQQLIGRREQQRAVAEGRFGELVEQVFPVLVDSGNVGRVDFAEWWRTMAHEVGPEAYVSQLEATMGRPDSRPSLRSIQCPVAVVHGTGDRLIASDNAVETADAIDGCRLTLVSEAGHLIAQEQPVAVAIAVAELLDAVTS